MKDVVAMLERQTGLKIKRIVYDSGREFMNVAWDEWLASTRTQQFMIDLRMLFKNGCVLISTP